MLEEREGKLVAVGRVGGLGRGERIYAVRFIGDVGYVVTFRQVDPLYTLDLSDPARPRVLGELKIPGYSAYLHPIGDDLLLGVGQDADRGRQAARHAALAVRRLGPRRPARLAPADAAGAGSSEAEYDHHAFLYWPPARLTVVPLATYGERARSSARSASASAGRAASTRSAGSPTEPRRFRYAAPSSWARASTRCPTKACEPTTSTPSPTRAGPTFRSSGAALRRCGSTSRTCMPSLGFEHVQLRWHASSG